MCRRPEAVLFDAGGTLITVRGSVGEVYAGVAAEYGVSVAPVDLNQAFHAEWARRRVVPGEELPLQTSEEHEREWWYDVARMVFRNAGVLDAFRTRFDDYYAELFEIFARADVWEIFPEVESALERLDREGIRKAVVSNWDSRLPRLMESLGLAQRFEFILTSAEAGFAKPHPAIFAAALSRMGLTPADVVYVGDSEADDVRGARSAGIRPMLVARNKAPSSVGAPVIANLEGIFDLI